MRRNVPQLPHEVNHSNTHKPSFQTKCFEVEGFPERVLMLLLCIIETDSAKLSTSCTIDKLINLKRS